MHAMCFANGNQTTYVWIETEILTFLFGIILPPTIDKNNAAFVNFDVVCRKSCTLSRFLLLNRYTTVRKQPIVVHRIVNILSTRYSVNLPSKK